MFGVLEVIALFVAAVGAYGVAIFFVKTLKRRYLLDDTPDPKPHDGCKASVSKGWRTMIDAADGYKLQVPSLNRRNRSERQHRTPRTRARCNPPWTAVRANIRIWGVVASREPVFDAFTH